MTNKKEIKITPPNISPETMKEMARFFMETSIPRIIAEMEKEGINPKTTIGRNNRHDI